MSAECQISYVRLFFFAIGDLESPLLIALLDAIIVGGFGVFEAELKHI
jgi:hypothetical protein